MKSQKAIILFVKELGLLFLFSFLFICIFNVCNGMLEMNGLFAKENVQLYLLHTFIFCCCYLLLSLLLMFTTTNYKTLTKIIATLLLNCIVIPLFLFGGIRLKAVYLSTVISTFTSLLICLFVYYLFARTSKK
jgi:hypothetical protein